MIVNDKFERLKRRSLEDKLEEAVKGPLTLVVASMGYGKTTLVRSFLDNQKGEIIWLPIGVDEVDDGWVWTRLCEILKLVNKTLYSQIQDLALPQTNQEIDTFISVIINALNRKTFLVVDDFHECSSESINRLLTRLAYENLPMLHIIIISRVYPDLPFEELMVKGYCTVIDQQQLTLSKAKVKEVFQANGITLTDEELDSVYTYTDGWISAVYLVVMDYKKIGRLRLASGVLHLLKTAIFDKFSADIKVLFAKMSLFDDFTIEEACYTSESGVSSYMLDSLIEKIGFLQHDALTDRYTMHALLRNVAAVELDKQNMDKNRLYLRYAQINEREGNLIPAIINYQKAGRTDKIFEIMEREGCYSLFENAPAVMSKIYDSITLEERLKYPILYLCYIYYNIIYENGPKGIKLFREAKEQYVEVFKGREDYDEIRGEIHIIDALLAFNDLEKVNENLEKATVLLGDKRSQVYDSGIMTFGTPESLTLWHVNPGTLRKTVELEKKYSGHYMRLVNRIDGGWNMLYEAEYLFTTGKIEEAEAMVKLPLEKARFRRQTCVIISIYYLLMRCAVYKGKPSAFEKWMEELKAEMAGISRSALVLDYELATGSLLALINRVDMVPGWLRNFELGACSHIVRGIRSGCVTYGILLRLSGQWILLDAIAEEMLVPYSASSHIYVTIYACIYKSIAARHLQNRETAMEWLEKAIELAGPDGIVPPFMENAPEILELLESMEPTAFIKKLILHSREHNRGLAVFLENKEEGILTKREQELIHLVEGGYRNSEISEMLSIALVTVEKTLTNIYRKLGVTNRTAAIVKIKELMNE